MRLPASQFGEELDFFPGEGHPHLIREAGGDQAGRHQGVDGLPVEDLHLFPAQAGFSEFETVFDPPSLPIHSKEALCLRFIFHRPVRDQPPGFPTGSQDFYLHEPEIFVHEVSTRGTFATDLAVIAELERASGHFHFHWLFFRSCLFAALDLHIRLNSCQELYALASLLPITSATFSPFRLPLDLTFSMVHSAHHMLLLLPNRAPHCHIVKAAIENPRELLV